VPYARASLELVNHSLRLLDELSEGRVLADGERAAMADAVSRHTRHTPTTEYVVALVRPLQILLGS
jgi:hypothetical protein